MISCRGCNRQLWHYKGKSPKWLCDYCALAELEFEKKFKGKRRSKKKVYEHYKLIYKVLYLKVIWSRDAAQLDDACQEVTELLLTNTTENNMELREIIEAGRQRRLELSGIWLDASMPHD